LVIELTKQEKEGMICLIKNEIESDMDLIADLEADLGNEIEWLNKKESKEKKAEWDFWLGEVVMLQNLLKRVKNED